MSTAVAGTAGGMTAGALTARPAGLYVAQAQGLVDDADLIGWVCLPAEPNQISATPLLLN
ncbi:hypothetical protein [[Kitasatospora] papulosa]|uniref:hypothetical protein n=1 Tax=[Kitasatospora] papulosa TaxID=1464011 RepID=UPI00403CF948